MVKIIDYFLAIDLGASSGRHLLGYIIDNKIHLEEVHRFKNELYLKDGKICWNLDYLFNEILIGMAKCKKLNKIPTSVAIDTWGVDFVLLDKRNNVIGDFISYRDSRTKGLIEDISKHFSKESIYKKTGIQFQEFNTLYQLKATPKKNLEKTISFLMVPDFFNFLLTGKMINEYTNLTTTQLLNIDKTSCDEELLEYLEVGKNIFKEIGFPKKNLGELKKEIADFIGYNCDVILAPTHDTACAFMANILNDSTDGIIISSGTWSLIGMEIDKPLTCKKSLKYNFTNEGGFDKKYRFLKNIMGLWIIQEVAKNLNYEYSFEELVNLAIKNKNFTTVFNVNDNRFFIAENMIEEINKYCLENALTPPSNVGELAICVYRSLALSYKEAIKELEEISGKTFKEINILGGGCQNTLLNELIKEELNLNILIGPIEATGLGNILTQMISKNILKDRFEAKKIIKNTINSGVKI
ncbi:rhamnulokinase [Cetobacterium sp.]|uniref:rhamnulokinase n=1 Tax=Cetobacterium sp. TaxID=2071632 RepID=UPI003F4050A2